MDLEKGKYASFLCTLAKRLCARARELYTYRSETMQLTSLFVEYAPLLVLVHNGLLLPFPILSLEHMSFALLVHVCLGGRRKLAAGRAAAANALQEPRAPNQIVEPNLVFEPQFEALERLPFGRCELVRVVQRHAMQQLCQRRVYGHRVLLGRQLMVLVLMLAHVHMLMLMMLLLVVLMVLVR